MKKCLKKSFVPLLVAGLERQSLLLVGWLLLAAPDAGQAQFNYTTNNSTITITSYTGTNSVVLIPDTIAGLPVTAIGLGAFSYNISLTSVTIPNSVTNIGGEAFENCTGLTSVSIPNSVTSIENYAFSYCTGLTNITIPTSVTSIEIGAFSYCTSLPAISVETNNPAYSSLDGVLFDKSQTTLIEYPSGKVGSYSIPTSVTGIGDVAFLECAGLTNITMDNSVTNIGVEAFQNCTGLTNITIPNSVLNIGVDAFYYCTSLTNITIPNSVTSIGDGAFTYCTSLTAIIVETNNLVYTSVDGVLFDKSQTTLIEYPSGKVGSYSIPNRVTGIGDSAFAGCTSLTNITIGNGVTSIGAWAFYDCSLANVTIPNGVTSIGYEAFAWCSSLTNITIPSSITSIGAYAFYACISLTSVTIPNSVTSIGDSAFGSCSSLTNVYFQGNAPSLGECVFGGNCGFVGNSTLDNATAYYLPGTTGWGSTVFGGIPTALWALPYPLVLNGSLGVRSNQFGFTVSWSTNLSVVVEASGDLNNPKWVPVTTNALNAGVANFTDPQWKNYPSRFYRVRSQ